MMRKSTLITLILLALMTAAALFAQDITAWINGSGGKPALAVIDFRGTGASQPLMEAFNSTLFSDLQSSGLFDMKAKSLFPLNNPQRPEDLRPDDNGQGFALQDWSCSAPQCIASGVRLRGSCEWLVRALRKRRRCTAGESAIGATDGPALRGISRSGRRDPRRA